MIVKKDIRWQQRFQNFSAIGAGPALGITWNERESDSKLLRRLVMIHLRQAF